jgi:hypothetical protein
MIAAIPSSQRAEMCNALANQLTMFTSVFVYVNNCSFIDYERLQWSHNVFLINETHIQGKGPECHNRVFRSMIDTLPVSDTLFIEDDVELSPTFVNHFLSTFKAVQSLYYGFSLSPIYIPEKKCQYTPVQKPIIHQMRHTALKNQRYVDGNFAVPENVMRKIKQSDAPYPVTKSSSGIGNTLSKMLYGWGCPMFVTIPSMLGHGDHESLQFPEGRKRVPLIARI